ncbi:YdeI/OmpD-associated family protein [Flavisolibacter nicotianae]|uniref:YdeI/OmpD-associated family protein n=1 Tax=Flavisolibacter nicotianae TaxID=2364882 RepID=UPI000EAB7622|nr:YdeI/OmpD-associated family protein [Flavisolibacter nicotianae]
MPHSNAKKLKIKEGYTLLTINAPKDFKTEISDLPEDVKISDKSKTCNQIHWFVKDKAQLDEEVEQVIALLKDDVTCWIYYPKGSSKIQTDLTRDKGWDNLGKHQDLQWLGLISFNETWSAFALRLQTAGDRKKEAAPKERPIRHYIDTAKKQVLLPDDFSHALKNAAKENAFFDTLSFTNKKEYVEWIVSAKREETRKTRVRESVERLAKGWKNPSNR